MTPDRPLLVSVLPRPPHASRDGLAIRNYHVLSALAEKFRVRAISLSDPARAYEGDWPAGIEAEIVTQPRRGIRRVASAAASLALGGAYSERMYRSAGLSRRLAALAGPGAAEAPAWVVAHAYHVGRAAIATGRAVWIDFHNLDSEIWRRTAESTSSPAVRRFARTQARSVQALEAELASSAAGVSAVSARDAAALRTLGARDVLVVPNGVDLARRAFRAEPPASETVLFVGDLSWPPNAEGVRWLLQDVWPRVRSGWPDARLEVLGRLPPRDLRCADDASVALLPGVEDAGPHWARAAVAVVPLTVGGGTRLKVLEAAAAGVPVVSTSIGAEGLELAAEREILKRDDAASFAAAVGALLSDPAAALRQAAAARARVEASYGWDRIARAFAAELRSRSERRA